MELPVSCPKHTHRKKNSPWSLSYLYSLIQTIRGVHYHPLWSGSVCSLTAESRSGSPGCLVRPRTASPDPRVCSETPTPVLHISAQRTELEQTHHQEINSSFLHKFLWVTCFELQYASYGWHQWKTNNSIKTPLLRWCMEAESCPACGAPVAKQCPWSYCVCSHSRISCFSPHLTDWRRPGSCPPLSAVSFFISGVILTETEAGLISVMVLYLFQYVNSFDMDVWTYEENRGAHLAHIPHVRW